MTDALIAAEGLAVSYGATPALHNVDFSVAPGEIVTLIGPNGSGKSTLVRALLGVVQPSAGRVTRRPGLRVGYVPQKLAVDARMPLTVARFLSLPVPQRGDEIAAMLARVGVAGLERRQMTGLSGGQFQRVLLARALLADPHLLILDEATQGLDQPGTAAFYELIAEVRRDTGAAILMVSHDLHVVMSASDRVVCLNGHVCCQGQPHVVTAAPEYRALFGLGTHGTMALYRHKHDHAHDACDHAAPEKEAADVG
ncbi:ATP-binding cassette domain-containing protein [Rhodovulum adriaticum]|uniref:Zinc transport system ATP-binding protein n=1 Tax=Rhodovulum adriaticum TaxID=35804 RepID=A0A4R2NKY8_RHOAD|nr:metal ABC transporter ATP-binding protein [Rhodovulum adriaticum]MBK1635490.1 zinc ABC transporter ATP-binding protein ZnuC [Rhodovulum adriaticum]TCP22062.1 zinc transport system ATP-binding protein [Rhodovulum adriaticum]